MTVEIVRGATKGGELLRSNRPPHSDEIPLTCSTSEFEGGGRCGGEVPVVDSFKVLEQTLALLRHEGLPVTRFNETLGAFLLADNEMRDMRQRDAGHAGPVSGERCRQGLRDRPHPEYDRKAEIPELVQIAAPMMLRTGASAQGHPSYPVDRATIEKGVQRVALGMQYSEKSGIKASHIGETSPRHVLPAKV